MGTTPDRPRQSFRALFLLFFLSGISGLIYESIWSRYIRQFVGSAATAQVLVLALFMGGMSLGALLAGRFMSRVRAPIVVYGIIEGLIGVYALAFPYLQDGMMRIAYDSIFPALGGGGAVTAAKWCMAAGLILPPCLLLGTTFPLMSVGILRRDLQRSGEILSMLYFTNSLGAAFGAVFSGFVLVGRFGLSGSLMIAAAINVFIMLVALRDRTAVAPIEDRSEELQRQGERGTLVWLFLAVAFGTGLSSFMYEIGWIRLLSMILGSATHSFEVMLSAFILGLAAGGLWVRKRMDRFRHPERVLAIVQLVMGLSAILTLPAYHLGIISMAGVMHVPEDVWIGDVRTETLWTQFNIVRYLLCLLVMFPATFCAGMTLPLLTHVMLKRGQSEAVVGQVYGLNTLGAITGAISAGLLLMPVVGLKGVIVIGALVDMLLGLVLLRNELRSGRSSPGTSSVIRLASALTVMGVTFGLAFPVDPGVLTSTVFRRGRTHLPEDYDVLSYVDGRTASVTVVHNTARPGHHIIYTNGKPDASVVLNRWPEGRDPSTGPDIAGDEPNQFLVGIVPLMARPDATHGALIGFGSGVTCHTILGSPHLQRLDTVEIEPEMVRGSSFFKPVNWRAYDDPRSYITFDDAKAYFATAGFKYDFIVSEPTNPWVSGVSSLFTVEFYREVKRYLKPGGVLAQWLQGYELSDELLVSVLAALDQEFADFLVVRIGERDWVILSSPDGMIGPLSSEVLSWPGLQDSFELLGIHDVGQIDGLITTNKRMLAPFLADRVANSDERPILDTGAEKARFMSMSAELMNEVRWTPAPVLEVFGGITQRPYPREGIGDLREPHILAQSETAMLLMRRFDSPEDTVAAEGLSTTPIDRWRRASEGAGRPDMEWNAWLTETFEVYRRVTPHLQVHETRWWQQVRGIAAVAAAPPMVGETIELLDALSHRDVERLWPAAERVLLVPASPLPRPFVAVAGAIALELQGADAATRRQYVSTYMDPLLGETTSEAYALEVLRDYLAR